LQSIKRTGARSERGGAAHEAGPVGDRDLSQRQLIHAHAVHAPVRELTPPHPAPVEFDQTVVAAGRQDAGVRRTDAGLRTFEVLQEARAVEQEDAGHINRLVEQHRVRDKLLQPFCSQVSGGFTYICNGTKRHDSTGLLQMALP